MGGKSGGGTMSLRADLQTKHAERDRIANVIAGLRKDADDLQSRAAYVESHPEASLATSAEADALATAGREILLLERALEEAERELVDSALAVFRAERDAEHQEVLTAVDALGLALARLLATDLAREALTGKRFAFDPVRHPPSDLWQPRPLVSALVAAMPRMAGLKGSNAARV
jgi:hypothetical protein